MEVSSICIPVFGIIRRQGKFTYQVQKKKDFILLFLIILNPKDTILIWGKRKKGSEKGVRGEKGVRVN